MKRKNMTLAGFALAAALVFAGCQAGATTTETNSKTEEKTAQKGNQKDTNNNTNKETDKNTKSSSSDSEEKNDDLLLTNLSAVSGNTVDLSKVSGNPLIEKGGTYTLSGSTDKTVVVDAANADVTLVLEGASISAKNLPAIYVRNAKTTTVEVKKDSTLASAGHEQADALNAALYVRSALTLKGQGTLTVTDSEEHGIKSKGDMTSSITSLKLTSGKDGIHASDSLNITNGIFSIDAGDEGIDVNDSLTVSNGNFTVKSAGDGLRAEDLVKLSNGTYKITTENEGIESKNEMILENGTYTINSQDDGINAINSLTIKGGTYTIVSAQNDGIDSNGDLIIEGGTIFASGLFGPEGAFDTDNTPFEIKGGTIVGLSATASLPTDCTQNTVMIAADQSFTKLELKQDGKTLISQEIPSSDASGMNSTSPTLTLSCKDLAAGKEAELYLDGKLAETFTVEEGLTKVGNIRTMGGGFGGGRQGGGNFERPEMDENFEPGQRPEMDEDFNPGERPEMDENFQPGQRPEMDENFNPEDMPERDENFQGGRQRGGRGRMDDQSGTQDGTSDNQNRKNNQNKTDQNTQDNQNNQTNKNKGNNQNEDTRSSASESKV